MLLFVKWNRREKTAKRETLKKNTKMENKDLSIGDKVETPISKIQGKIVQLGFQEGKDYYDIAFENGSRHWMLDFEIRSIN